MLYKNITIDWLGHSGFKIKTDKAVIYLDPYKISENSESADIIFITHDHYDHFSIEDISKISTFKTKIIGPPELSSKIGKIKENLNLHIAEPNSRAEFKEFNIKYWAVPAYNLNKSFHSKEELWLGYIIQIENILVYHAGDTDLIPEMKNINNIDLALLPIGGTYTMNAGEAAKAASIIKPKLAIPMHYGTIQNTADKSATEIFLKLCSSEGVDAKVLDKI